MELGALGGAKARGEKRTNAIAIDSGVYSSETAALMKKAIEIACSKIQTPTKNAEFVRLLLASSIIDYFETGVSDAEQLANFAIEQLNAALRIAGSQVEIKSKTESN
jgi:hypothetical protein